MASLTQWTWLWVNSGSWWWTGRPGMLWFIGSQNVGHILSTKLNWSIFILLFLLCEFPVCVYFGIIIIILCVCDKNKKMQSSLLFYGECYKSNCLKQNTRARLYMTVIILFNYFLKFIYFNWRLITLQYCIGFAIHQHESATGVHVFPILNPPHLLPRTIPLGHPSAPALSILYHASNLDWWFISYVNSGSWWWTGRPCVLWFVGSQRQTQRSPEGPRHLHRIPRLSEAPWEVP